MQRLIIPLPTLCLCLSLSPAANFTKVSLSMFILSLVTCFCDFLSQPLRRKKISFFLKNFCSVRHTTFLESMVGIPAISNCRGFSVHLTSLNVLFFPNLSFAGTLVTPSTALCRPSIWFSQQVPLVVLHCLTYSCFCLTSCTASQ